MLLIQADLQYPLVTAKEPEVHVIDSADISVGKLYVEKNQVTIVGASPEKREEGHSGTSRVVGKKLKKMKFETKRLYSSDEQLLAQLVEAEAGNQDSYGKRLVADVVLNRVDSDIFPNNIYDVIHQKYQFSVIGDGRFAKMASRISKGSLEAARKEMHGPRIDRKILYFNSGSYCMNGSGGWKYKGHWFAY